MDIAQFEQANRLPQALDQVKEGAVEVALAPVEAPNCSLASLCAALRCCCGWHHPSRHGN